MTAPRGTDAGANDSFEKSSFGRASWAAAAVGVTKRTRATSAAKELRRKAIEAAYARAAPQLCQGKTVNSYPFDPIPRQELSFPVLRDTPMEPGQRFRNASTRSLRRMKRTVSALGTS